MLGKVSLVLVLIAAPLISQAQVTNLVINPSFEDENDIVDCNWVAPVKPAGKLAVQWAALRVQQ